MAAHVPHVALQSPTKTKKIKGNFGQFGTMWHFDSFNWGPLGYIIQLVIQNNGIPIKRLKLLTELFWFVLIVATSHDKLFRIMEFLKKVWVKL